MVVDTLENLEKYASLNPLFAQAIEFLKSHDLQAMEIGKTELKGKDLLVNIAQTKPKTKEEAKLETHNEFIDIQIPLITDNTTQTLWDCTSIAKELGILSESGRPHDKAVSGIIQDLDIFEDEIVRTAFSRNGHDGVTVQYKGSVLEKVREWLEENHYPSLIELQLANGNVNKCKVLYREVA